MDPSLRPFSGGTSAGFLCAALAQDLRSLIMSDATSAIALNIHPVYSLLQVDPAMYLPHHVCCCSSIGCSLGLSALILPRRGSCWKNAESVGWTPLGLSHGSEGQAASILREVCEVSSQGRPLAFARRPAVQPASSRPQLGSRNTAARGYAPSRAREAQLRPRNLRTTSRLSKVLHNRRIK